MITDTHIHLIHILSAYYIILYHVPMLQNYLHHPQNQVWKKKVRKKPFIHDQSRKMDVEKTI